MGGAALMAQENVFGDLLPSTGSAPTQTPGVIYGRPKQPAPIDPLDAAMKGIQIQKGQADLADRGTPTLPTGFRWKNGQIGGDAEPIPGVPVGTNAQLTAAQRNTLVSQRNSLKLFEQRIGGIDNLYKDDFKGFRLREIPYAIGFGDLTLDKLAPKSLKPKAERFDAAGATLMGELKAAMGMTGGEANSPAEVELRFGPYIPKAEDADETIEQKLSMLRQLLESELRGVGEQLGEPVIPSDEQPGVKEPAGGGSGATWTKEQSLAHWGEELYDQSRNPLGPEGGPSFDAEGNPKGFAAEVNAATAPPPPLDNEPGMGQAFLQGAGSVAQGAGEILGIVGNPANAAINSMFGTDLSTDLGRALRDASGLPDNPNGVSDAIIRAGTGALAGTGLAGLAARLPGAVGSAAQIAAAQPGRQMAAGMAAGGTGEQLNQEGVGPAGQIAGALAAGGLTYSGGNALAGLANRASGAPNALLETGRRQGVDILPADAGGALTRRLTGAAAQAPVSASPIVSAARRQGDQFRGAVQRAARSQGETLDTDVAGEQVRKAGQQYVKNESARIGRMYERAGQSAKGIKIKPNQALSEIDAQIARFSELGDVGAPIVKSLEGLRGSIEGGVSVQGMRDARSILSQGVYDGKLRSSQEQKLLGDVLEKLSSDIDLGLRNAGREDAARTFKRADTLWRERIQHIDEVLEPVIGKAKSGEDVLKAIDGMTRGNSGGAARLRGIMRELPPEQAGNIRATVIDRLGRATAGQQDDLGQQFSSATFLTNWNKMTPQAKTVMFADTNLRGNLDDIAKIASASKEASRYANHSNTAGGMLGNVGGAVGLAAFEPTIAATALTSQYLTGRLLASPRFTAWLARAPKNPAAQGRYIEQLGVVAAREPAIAGDAQALQQHLMQAFGASPARAAASEKEPDRREEPIGR